jgi:predicted Zn-ribbon and HTH transcriptional regulator
MGTLRQQIAALLREEPMTAMDISQAVRIPEKDVYRHLAHIQRSATGQGKELRMIPCTCRACGFVFRERRRLTRPGRCPRCRESRIDSPVFRIVEGK